MWPILIISLADATARRQKLLGRLAALGLGATQIEAVDGRHGLPPAYEAQLDRDAAQAHYHRRIMDVEFACTFSHRRAYQHILDQGLDGAVVLEDDAVPQPGFDTFMTQEGYRAADLVLLDHLGAYFLPWGKSVHPTPATQARAMINVPTLTTGYSISADAALRILNARPKVDRTADWPVDIRRLGALAVRPRLVRPDDGAGSAIEASRDRSIQSGTGRWRIVGPPTRGDF